MLREDQAAGLRKMFGERSARVVAFVSADEGCAPSLLLSRTAVSLASSGQGVTVIDERGEPHGAVALLSERTPPDLFHVLTGEYSAHQAIQSVSPFLRVALAARAAQAMESGEYGLQERYGAILKEAKRDAAYVLVDCSRTRRRTVLSALALQSPQIVLLTTPRAESITKCYAMLKRIVRDRHGEGLSLAVAGAKSMTEARFAAENIQRVAQEHLGIVLQNLGAVGEDFADALNYQLPHAMPSRQCRVPVSGLISTRDSVI